MGCVDMLPPCFENVKWKCHPLNPDCGSQAAVCTKLLRHPQTRQFLEVGWSNMFTIHYSLYSDDPICTQCSVQTSCKNIPAPAVTSRRVAMFRLELPNVPWPTMKSPFQISYVQGGPKNAPCGSSVKEYRNLNGPFDPDIWGQVLIIQPPFTKVVNGWPTWGAIKIWFCAWKKRARQ